MFRRPETDRCNGCLTEHQRGWYVPLCLDEEGQAWGYTSVPQEAVDCFGALSEASEADPGWSMALSAWGSEVIEGEPCG